MDLTWGLFFPLILAGLVYAVATVAAGVMASRGNEARAERVRDAGFVIVLLAGAWVIVLLLLAMFSEPDELWDMVTITLVIVVFFVILLLVLFGISLLVGRIGGRADRRRVTTDEL